MNTNLHFERVDTGRAIGHDLFRYGRPGDDDDWPAPVLEGYAAARAGEPSSRPPDRFVRKWLQLRLGAYQRGRVVNADVTPDFLREIDVAICPVTRTALTHGRRRDSDWSVDRLNNDGAYAVNNLAVMSARANRAKGTQTYEEVFARSRLSAATQGLEPVEWLRLAALMLGPCFATRPADAPAIPLLAPLPNRSLRTTVQQIQHVLTLSARTQAGKNALIKHLKVASPTPNAQLRLRVLCESLHQGMKGRAEAHDVWLAAPVMEAFRAWQTSLDAWCWALAGEISRQLSGGRTVPAARLRSWHLAQGGYHA